MWLRIRTTDWRGVVNCCELLSIVVNCCELLSTALNISGLRTLQFAERLNVLMVSGAQYDVILYDGPLERTVSDLRYRENNTVY
jgi:hypothetical protein